MAVRILQGDVRDVLPTLAAESVDCVVTSPPYWGLRTYLPDGHPDKAREIGLERTLGEHLEVLLSVFREVRRVMKPQATLWLNYGDCYATSPNGRSAAATKAAGNDDRTFRDKPFSTVGPIYGRGDNLDHPTVAGVRKRTDAVLKPKDLCMLPNRLAISLQEDGWWVRSEIIWGKANPMPDSSGKYRPSTAHEKIFMLAKSAKCFYDAEAVAQPVSENTHLRVSQDVANQIRSERANGGRKTNGNMKAVVRKQDGHGRRHAGLNERYFGQPGVTPKSAAEDTNIRAKGSFHATTAGHVDTRYLRNYEPAPTEVWEITTQPFSGAHFATFPAELARRCILAGCPKGGTILDPFIGSGTTGLVADRLGRNCIGIELVEGSCVLAADRVRGDAPLFAEVAAQ